jgi:hypothetical protein
MALKTTHLIYETDENSVPAAGLVFTSDGLGGGTWSNGSGTNYVYYSEVLSPEKAIISITSSGSTNSVQLNSSFTEIGYVNDSDGWFSNLIMDGTSPTLNITTGYNDGSSIGRVSVAQGSINYYTGPISNSGTYSTVNQDFSNGWRAKHYVDNNQVSEFKVAPDGITLNVNGVGSEIYIQNIPTSNSGLSSGAIYTQTAAELGGSGTTKVICTSDGLGVVSSIRKYVAMISQPGGTPSATILENNLIDSDGLPVIPTFSYLGTGTWQIIGVTGSFIPAKTITQWSTFQNAGSVFDIHISDIATPDDRIEFYTFDLGGTLADGIPGSFLTITVYP